MTHRERIEMYLREGRPVSGGKGSATDQAAAHNELSFQTTLMNAFKAQFGKQAAVLQFLQGRLTGMMSKPTGFDPETLAAMRSEAINENALAVQGATKAAQTSEAAHGGAGLPSGVSAQIEGQIASSGANALSGELNQIAIQNGLLQNQNYWKATGALTGIAEAYNPLGYAGGSTSAGSSIANLSEASTQADQSGFLGQFANKFGSTLGSTVGGGSLSGGSGSPFGGNPV